MLRMFEAVTQCSWFGGSRRPSGSGGAVLRAPVAPEPLFRAVVFILERMGGEGLGPTELEDLAEYLVEGLIPPPNPHIQSAVDDPQVALGEQLYWDAKVGCGNCHNGPTLTDGLLHDVGTMQSDPLDEVPKLNTPSLWDVWSTPPYLHDGSAETLMDVLVLTKGKMGEVTQLSEAELEALVAYIRTL